MKIRVLYHVARADFLERVRGYTFLIVLGVMIAVAYLFVPAAGASYVTIDLDGYRGVYNSAWIGASVAFLTAGYLGFGFFLVAKGSISRDRDTGVGQIIATTPISKPFYIFGKWLSNLAVLTAMTAMIVIAAGVMQLVRGEDNAIDVWVLVAPFLIVVLPTVALVAALSLVFETIPRVRGGLGNIVFFFAWLILGFPLARIHRRTALGTALEEASGCSSESGIMVLEQKPARKQGAPNRCCHRTNPTVSASSLTTIAWWPMPACSCRPP